VHFLPPLQKEKRPTLLGRFSFWQYQQEPGVLFTPTKRSAVGAPATLKAEFEEIRPVFFITPT
jgi:hypothetical protein